MGVQKPKLSIDDQINHLKENGVQFNIMTEEDAQDYLLNHNNYFKLTAYRKNYDKHPDGENKGKYIKLEFAYLVDLAVIDMRLRYQIVHMALDIEHHTKLRLLQKIDNSNEDGYKIVQDYIDSLPEKQKKAFDNEIERSKGSIYCGDIIDKYDGNYPVWAFVEIIPFGRLVSFYKYCADKFSDSAMIQNYYRLLTCKEIRNAAAHSNCIINDLKTGTSSRKTSHDVTKALGQIKGISKNYRNLKMSNARIQQIVTLLFVHRDIVGSQGIQVSESEELHKLLDRMYRNAGYYSSNPLVSGTFDFLKLVIDNWFPMA